jgi:hypothetical protein
MMRSSGSRPVIVAAKLLGGVVTLYRRRDDAPSEIGSHESTWRQTCGVIAPGPSPENAERDRRTSAHLTPRP